MFDEALKAELERLRQENAALKKGAAAGISMKKHLFAAAQRCCDLNERIAICWNRDRNW
ncbi:MAG TPA: hypothetical protein VMS82_02910 [Pseudolabrys sp.]|nr:hypothetical protein [Pseudolabrys sp.]